MTMLYWCIGGMALLFAFGIGTSVGYHAGRKESGREGEE